jgi:NAD(P)-dependent dehydrogenase (short-subunit alcohol dehydrogenase family)
MSKTALITGANRGIGLEYARFYVSQGYKVYGTSRAPYASVSDLAALIPAAQHIQLDAADPSSVAKLRSFAQPLDLLINNAGMLIKDDLATLTAEALTEQFKVNTLGPVLITQALQGVLSAGSKVVNITSRFGSIEDNTSGNCHKQEADTMGTEFQRLA